MYPYLYSLKILKDEFQRCNKLNLHGDEISIGRGLDNTCIISHVCISRKHCKIIKQCDDWVLRDYSSFGIKVNGKKLDKNTDYTLKNDDIIQFDLAGEFTYKVVGIDECEIPRKQIKLEAASETINLMKVKFEESQSIEKEHLEVKIMNAKQLHNETLLMKQHLENDMARQVEDLKSDFAKQIHNLKGEKEEVEREKKHLEDERDQQLASIKQKMEEKISDLLRQIEKHNDLESQLLNENNLLKEKLIKEREEFLSELNRECTSKQDMLEQLEAKIREQEESRAKEKIDFEQNLRIKTEQLQAIKEKELQDLEEQKRQRELELQEELKKLREKAELVELEKAKTEQQLLDKIEHINKQNENIKQMNEEKDKEQELEKQKACIVQEKQSTEITSLQIQLETVRSQLASIERERKALIGGQNLGNSSETIQTVCNVMDAELQCSICSELFLSATTLSCSHTFCRYCIYKWIRNRNECPNCRSEITSVCSSLALDSFIERMAGLTEEMKKNRQQIIKEREELEAQLSLEADDWGGTEEAGIEPPETQEVEEEEDHDGDEYYVCFDGGYHDLIEQDFVMLNASFCSSDTNS